MDLRQLEVFVTVAETKSFSKAADFLFLSQSTVSSHIKNLEQELQKVLLFRSTKSIQLSPEGKILLGYAKRILATKDAALEALSTHQETILHLGASTIPSSYLLPDLLCEFRRQLPQVYFDIQQGNSSDTIVKVIDGTVDFAIVGQKEMEEQCTFIPFCQDELVIVTPSTDYYISLKKQNPDIPRLLEEPIILREQGSGTGKSADLYLNSIHISPHSLNVIARINDLESTKQMIKNGMGISILSRFAIKDLEQTGQIISYPIETDIHRSFYICYQNSKNLKPIVKEFIDFTLSSFGQS